MELWTGICTVSPHFSCEVFTVCVGAAHPWAHSGFCSSCVWPNWCLERVTGTALAHKSLWTAGWHFQPSDHVHMYTHVLRLTRTVRNIWTFAIPPSQENHWSSSLPLRGKEVECGTPTAGDTTLKLLQISHTHMHTHSANTRAARWSSLFLSLGANDRPARFPQSLWQPPVQGAVTPASDFSFRSFVGIMACTD